MKQLALASSKLTQLEAEREHWRLEHQLLQCKHQKEAKVRILSLHLSFYSVDILRFVLSNFLLFLFCILLWECLESLILNVKTEYCTNIYV